MYNLEMIPQGRWQKTILYVNWYPYGKGINHPGCSMYHNYNVINLRVNVLHNRYYVYSCMPHIHFFPVVLRGVKAVCVRFLERC
jgi:hypothetical protein